MKISFTKQEFANWVSENKDLTFYTGGSLCESCPITKFLRAKLQSDTLISAMGCINNNWEDTIPIWVQSFQNQMDLFAAKNNSRNITNKDVLKVLGKV